MEEGHPRAGRGAALLGLPCTCSLCAHPSPQQWPRCHEPHLQVRPQGRHPEILKGSLGPAEGVRDRRQPEDQGPPTPGLGPHGADGIIKPSA